MKCKGCKSEIDKSKLSKHASGGFCSESCSRRYAQSKVNNNDLKIGNCCQCGKEILIKKRASSKISKCENCKIRKALIRKKFKNVIKNKKICKICGQEKPCKRPDICKRYPLFPTLSKYFGFDENKIGNIKVYEEFDKIRNLLIEDYIDNEMSCSEMVLKYNYPSHAGNFSNILRSMNIKTRSLSESQICHFKNNGYPEYLISSKYKHGWHKTGNNKGVFYRSSYELDYAKQLDEQQIDYDMENLRILYGDSQLLRQRVAIPDFYLLESNTIVEVKSDGTYDKQNMKDKIKAYKEHGYNYKLILEKKETKINYLIKE